MSRQTAATGSAIRPTKRAADIFCIVFMDELARRTCERVPGYSFPASGDLICVSEAACGFTHHEDDLPANHCNGRFHVVGKSQRAHFHHRVKQYSTRRRSAMSKRPR